MQRSSAPDVRGAAYGWNRNPMLGRALWAGVLCMLWIGVAPAAENVLRLTVSEPYIDLHTGPGAGYPIYHVIERGEPVEILKRRTYWFKVRDVQGKEGWVEQEQLRQTLTDSGHGALLLGTTREDFATRRFEVALMGGDFDGAAVLAMTGTWRFTDTFATELALSQILGEFSSSWMVHGSLIASPFPEWRVAPFIGLGVGSLHTDPRATLVQADDDVSNLASFSIGARTHISRRFVLRVDYSHYVVFKDADNNEDHEEWKAGIAFFF